MNCVCAFIILNIFDGEIWRETRDTLEPITCKNLLKVHNDTMSPTNKSMTQTSGGTLIFLFCAPLAENISYTSSHNICHADSHRDASYKAPRCKLVGDPLPSPL